MDPYHGKLPDEAGLIIPPGVVNWAVSLPMGKHDLGPYVIVKDKKMTAIRPKTPYSSNVYSSAMILVYPNDLQTREKLSELAPHMRSSGPASLNPGAAGTIALYRNKGDHFFVDFIQSHYRTNKDKEAGLSRSESTKLAGWVRRALSEAIDHTATHGSELRFPKKLIADKGSLNVHIAEISKKKGASMHTVEGGEPALIIRPKHHKV